ncbi:MAG: hypothetical protein JXB18_01230 [Sedimentisphaerales bacterium]|nr:hypothetical protein [Sedimentisphaerales bacterium]
MKQTRVISYLMVSIIIAGLASCKDNPDDAAVTKLQKSTTAALAQYSKDRDVKAAQESLQTALSSTRPTGLTGGSSLFCSAGLMITQAQMDRSALQIQTHTLSQSIEAFNIKLEQLADLTAQSERVQKLLTLSDEEIADLQKWIGTEQEATSLKGKIVLAQAEVNQLTEKKAALEKEFMDNRDKMLALESQADNLLRQANTASGQQKADLEKSAFDIRDQKKPFTMKAQDAENALGLVHSQLAIMQPHLERLLTDLQAAEVKLRELKASPARENLRVQQQELAREVEAGSKALADQKNLLTGQINEFLKKTDAVIAAVEQAIEQFKQINARQLEPNLSMSLGNAYALLGSLYAQKVNYTSDMGTRLESILQTYQSIVPEGITSPVASAPDTELAKKGLEAYDLARKAFDDALAASSQLRTGSKEAELAAIKGQMLTLKNKSKLADRLGDFDTAEKADAELEQLMQKAKEYGMMFNQSATAMLLTKGLDYIPTLPVDTAMILEGIKKEFTNWRRLRGPAQEEEVTKLLARITDLKSEYAGDDQIIPYLDQEQKDMEEQKAKGFTEEAAAAEPNSLDAGAPPMNPVF